MKFRNSLLALALGGAFVAAPAFADNPDNPKSPASPYAGTVPEPQAYQPENTTPGVIVTTPDVIVTTPNVIVAPDAPVMIVPDTAPFSSEIRPLRPNPNDIPMFPPPDRDLKAAPN